MVALFVEEPNLESPEAMSMPRLRDTLLLPLGEALTNSRTNMRL